MRCPRLSFRWTWEASAAQNRRALVHVGRSGCDEVRRTVFETTREGKVSCVDTPWGGME